VTVIAWDGRTLAADRMLCEDTTPLQSTKISKVRTPQGYVLLGVAGRATCLTAYRRWAENGFDPDRWPDALDQDGTGALVVFPSGSIWEFENTRYPIELPDQNRAIGTGRVVALTAMHLGFSAKRAVEVACELDIRCGMGVDALTFTKAERRG